jgi:hypothetical protein
VNAYMGGSTTVFSPALVSRIGNSSFSPSHRIQNPRSNLSKSVPHKNRTIQTTSTASRVGDNNVFLGKQYKNYDTRNRCANVPNMAITQFSVHSSGVPFALIALFISPFYERENEEKKRTVHALVVPRCPSCLLQHTAPIPQAPN